MTDSIEAVRSSVDKALAQVQIFSAVSGEIVALRIESLSWGTIARVDFCPSESL